MKTSNERNYGFIGQCMDYLVANNQNRSDFDYSMNSKRLHITRYLNSKIFDLTITPDYLPDNTLAGYAVTKKITHVANYDKVLTTSKTENDLWDERDTMRKFSDEYAEFVQSNSGPDVDIYRALVLEDYLRYYRVHIEPPFKKFFEAFGYNSVLDFIETGIGLVNNNVMNSFYFQGFVTVNPKELIFFFNTADTTNIFGYPTMRDFLDAWKTVNPKCDSVMFYAIDCLPNYHPEYKASDMWEMNLIQAASRL